MNNRHQKNKLMKFLLLILNNKAWFQMMQFFKHMIKIYNKNLKKSKNNHNNILRIVNYKKI